MPGQKPPAPIKGKQPHLADMFTTGELYTVVYPEFPEVDVWITRPTSQQNQLAQKQARIARARRIQELTEGTDESVALELQVNEMTKEEVVEALVSRERRTFEQQAYNEILYAEPGKSLGDDEEEPETQYGKYWGPEGSQYVDLLDAQIARMDEIKQHNIEQEAGGGNDIINPISDEEMLRLHQVSAVFEKQTLDRVNELVANKTSELSRKPIDKLRRELHKSLVDAECDMLWFETYKTHMLYYAVRYPDSRHKLYFQNVDQISDLPQAIQSQLFSKYDDVDMGAQQTKNLLTPLSS